MAAPLRSVQARGFMRSSEAGTRKNPKEQFTDSSANKRCKYYIARVKRHDAWRGRAATGNRISVTWLRLGLFL